MPTQVQQSQWPAAVVAVAFIAFVAAIFLAVYLKDGIDNALKAWGAIGTIVGVLTGGIPSFFFQQSAKTAQRNASALLAAADEATVQRATQQFGLRLTN